MPLTTVLENESVMWFVIFFIIGSKVKLCANKIVILDYLQTSKRCSSYLRVI